METPLQKQKPIWFNIQEAADYLDVKEPTIYRWMREGLITYRKVGDSTRFWKEDLDAVMQVHPSAKDASQVQEFCPVCHHDGLVEGRVQSTGLNHFYPEKPRFWTLKGSHVATHARMCTRCGVIIWFGDTGKLSGLKQKSPATESGWGKSNSSPGA